MWTGFRLNRFQAIRLRAFRLRAIGGHAPADVAWWLTFSAIVVAAIALRVGAGGGAGGGAGIGARELFRDEAASWLLTSYPLPELLKRVAHEPYPPLYPILLSGWTGWLGDSEAGLRLFSVIAGVVSVVATGGWANQALGRFGGIVAAAVVALSPFALQDSLDARMYALEGALATVAWWLLWRLVAGRASTRRARSLHAVLLAVMVAGEVWTLALGIPLAALQLLVPLAVILWGMRGALDRVGGARGTSGADAATGASGAHPATEPRRASGAAWAIAGVIAGAVSLAPWIPNLLSTAGRGQFWTPIPDLTRLPLSFASLIEGWPDLLQPPAIVIVGTIGALVALGIALLGARTLLRTRGASGALIGWIALAGTALVPVVWAISQFRSIYDSRYFMPALPPLALLVAAGAEAAALGLLGRMRWRGGVSLASSGVALNLSRAAVLAILLVPTLGSVAAWAEDWPEGGRIAPSREVVARLHSLARPGDVILAADARSYFPLAYYAHRSPEGAAAPGVPLLVWDSGLQPFFSGQVLIEDRVTIRTANRSAAGLRAALPQLGPGGRLWLVSVANNGSWDLGFSPLHDGLVGERQWMQVGEPGAGTGQIVEIDLGAAPGP